MREKIFFYYTSDLHSHFEKWPKLAGYIEEKRQEHEARGEDVFVFDNGDHVDRFHPIAEGLKGKGNVELLNASKYDVVNIGNNEGITLSENELYHLYDEAVFPVVCANVTPMEKKNPAWLKPYEIKTTSTGVRVGIIGLTAPFRVFYQLLGWNVEPPETMMEKYMDEVKSKSDIIILLSHLGYHTDRQMAEDYPGLDVIIGGHTHHLLPEGEMHNGVLLTAAGKHGTHLGEIFLDWDQEQKTLVNKEAYTVASEKLTNSEAVEERLDHLESRAHRRLYSNVADLKEPLEADWFEDTPLMNELTEELRNWTSADIAMLNAGVLLEGLEEGPVTYADLHRICPHPMNPCKVHLSGKEIVEVVRSAHTKQITEFKLKGLGFRGEVIGKMVFAGLEIETVTSSDGDEHVRKVLFDGEPIERNRWYSFATADTFSFGRFFPEINHSTTKTYYLPEMLRDLLVKVVQSMVSSSSP
ncbi:bifunctional metallophosphatase/5'-nucleotidase [Salimicrobium halophilum]|uniref:2',3'-cyclic-nucleotide 2'-phosphodiesterase/5'-or 3'-nucleotidase, 5'-nucleotidase family n=1 Tax=Salimicrobium halophilum TaxID=86666 RepID=A0A1G8VA47_9BACI|nr:bifunctional UDP-sugar hydrolase/5'-nucleotidase [Salimicrobium halophilum]SDJ62764.1 2',3'-cyclic-nucleotide 2'-phosphodiesterase/5'-or 3'-nucleotidase, 5'-nucleotidase family [Salimicrobium halophilum]